MAWFGGDADAIGGDPAARLYGHSELSEKLIIATWTYEVYNTIAVVIFLEYCNAAFIGHHFTTGVLGVLAMRPFVHYCDAPAKPTRPLLSRARARAVNGAVVRAQIVRSSWASGRSRASRSLSLKSPPSSASPVRPKRSVASLRSSSSSCGLSTGQSSRPASGRTPLRSGARATSRTGSPQASSSLRTWVSRACSSIGRR